MDCFQDESHDAAEALLTEDTRQLYEYLVV